MICHVRGWLNVFVMSNGLNRNHSRIYPPHPWPPWTRSTRGLCPVPSALWPWATSAMEQVQPWGTADGSSQNRDWLGWGGRSDHRQGTLTQKCCLQLEPKFQRVQVLGLPKGALECNRAALSGDRGWKGTKCWWEAKGSPRFARQWERRGWSTFRSSWVWAAGFWKSLLRTEVSSL